MAKANVNAEHVEATETAEATETVEKREIVFKTNVKYNENRYSIGEKIEVNETEYQELLEAGVIDATDR